MDYEREISHTPERLINKILDVNIDNFINHQQDKVPICDLSKEDNNNDIDIIDNQSKNNKLPPQKIIKVEKAITAQKVKASNKIPNLIGYIDHYSAKDIEPHNLGPRNFPCKHCGALFFENDKLVLITAAHNLVHYDEIENEYYYKNNLVYVFT